MVSMALFRASADTSIRPHRVPLLREHLGDPVSHRAGTDHRDPHHAFSLRVRRHTAAVARMMAQEPSAPPSGPKFPPVSHCGPPGS